MRILYIVGTYPLVTTTFIEREVATLRALGSNIELLSIRRPPRQVTAAAEYRALQNEVRYLLPPNLIRLLLAHLYFAFKHPRAYWSLLFWLLTRSQPHLRERMKTLLHFGEGVYAAFLVRGVAFDHIHAHFIDRAALVALCVARMLEKSYSVTAHANDIYRAPVLVSEKILSARFAVTVSEFNKQHLLTHFAGLDAERIFVLHPWVDMDEFRPPAVHAGNPRFRILSVGRLVEKKGQRYLIEACAQLREQRLDFECIIIGDGPLQQEFEALVNASELSQHVCLLGAQPKTIVLEELRRADVFVLPVVVARDGDRDGMPVALAEAMAMQVPVISTDIVGIRELLQPGTGYLIPPNDATAVADAIHSMIGLEQSARLAMGKRGRAVIAKDFELKKGVSQLAELFASSDADLHSHTAPGLMHRPHRRQIKSGPAHWLQRKVRGIF